MLLFLSGAGSYPCLVSNSLKASKLTINQPVAPIEEFNQKYLPHVFIKICLFFFLQSIIDLVCIGFQNWALRFAQF